jgi:hypothetical protein
VRDCSRAYELTIACAIAAEFVIPAMINVTYANTNTQAMHWASIYGEDTTIRSDREIDWYVETAASNVGTESDGIYVVEFVFRLNGHNDLNELVLAGGDNELKKGCNGFVGDV